MSFPVLQHLDLTGNQLLNAGLQQLATDPATPFEGQIWQNTTSGEVKARLLGVTQIIQSGLITSADIQDATIVDTDVAAANKDGAAGTPSLRTLGTGATQALPGNAAPVDAGANVGSMRTLGTGVAQALPGSTRLDTIASPTGAVGLNGQRLTGLADGVAASDGATVGQVTNAIAGLDTKPSVKAATTGQVALSGPQTIDGIALVAGDRVLVRAQTAPAENGVYLVAAGTWTRVADFDSWTEIPGALVAVEQGATLADAVYVSTADQGGTLNTTAITFSRLNTPATGTAKYAGDIVGNATTTQFTVTHNLGTTDVHVQVYDSAADLYVLTDVKRPTSNTVRIDFAQAPATGKLYRVVVVG